MLIKCWLSSTYFWIHIYGQFWVCWMYWKNIELCNQLQKDQNQSKTWGWPSLMGVSSPWKCIIIFCKPWWEQSNVIKVLRIGRRAQSMISCLIPETMLGTDFVWKNWEGIQKNQEKIQENLEIFLEKIQIIWGRNPKIIREKFKKILSSEDTIYDFI